MVSSVHDDNIKKNMFILGKVPTDGYNDTTQTAEKEQHKKFCLTFHYNRGNSFSFANGFEINRFKAKDWEINATPLCRRNVSKYISVDNMKKARLNGYVYDLV